MNFSNFTAVSDPPTPGMIPRTDPSILTAEKALPTLTANSGVTRVGPFVPRYDALDQRNINGLKSIISVSSPAQRTGDVFWNLGSSAPSGMLRPATQTDATSMANAISFQSSSRPTGFHSDWDGIPDSREDASGTNKNSASDGAQVAAGQAYYTNLENHLNSLAGDTVPGASQGSGGPAAAALQCDDHPVGSRRDPGSTRGAFATG